MYTATLLITTCLALAAAQSSTSSNPSPYYSSLTSVVINAIPTSASPLISASPSIWLSRLASEVDAGYAPGWFSSLPEAGQDLLVPSDVASSSSSPSSSYVYPEYSSSSSGVAGLPPSVAAAIVTALPSSVLAYALDSPSAWASNLYADITAGDAPGWYKELPYSIKTAINPSLSISSFPYSSSISSFTTTPRHDLPSSSSQTPTHTGDPSPTPVGAIAGGVVGGVVGVAAVAGIVVLILFRRKRKDYVPPMQEPMREVSGY